MLRTIRWRDMRLFLINIFLISILYTISLSIFLGIGQTEPFVSETDNTIVITEPGKEPLFSRVPTYLTGDLLRLDGAIAVSPEIVDFCYQVDKDQPVFVRGVTDEFPKVLDTYKIRSGRWFNLTSGTMEGVVGTHYANKMGIQSGESILLASRRTDFLISVTIVGIIESDTNADDSILLPLWISQTMSEYPTTEVNLMRIRFDPKVTSGQKIRDTVNGEFQVTIETQRHNFTHFDPINTNVSVYDRSHELIYTMIYSASEPTIAFLLPFGTYTLVASSPNIAESRPTTVFVDKDRYIKLFVGNPYTSLSVQVFHNEMIASAANVTLLPSNGNYYYSKTTNEEGNATFLLPEGIYSLQSNYSGAENQTLISIFGPSNIQINLTTALLVSTLNVTTMEPLVGAVLTLSDENGTLQDSKTANDDGMVYLQGQPGLAILNASWKDFERLEYLTIGGITELNLTLGYATAIVNVLSREQGPVDNALVEVKQAGAAIESSTTNTSGVAQFDLLTGTYEFHAKSETLGEESSRSIKFDQTTEIDIFLGLQPLIVRVLNVTTQDPVFDSEIAITDINEPRIRAITTTNATGYGVVFTRFGSYRVTAAKAGIITLGGIFFSAENAKQVTTLWLGNVSVTLTTLDSNNEAINANITLYLLPVFLNTTIRDKGPTLTVWTYPGRYGVIAENNSWGYALFDEIELIRNKELTLTLQRESLNLSLLYLANESTVRGKTVLKFSVLGYNGTLQYRWDGGQNQTARVEAAIETARFTEAPFWETGRLGFIEAPGSSGLHILETTLFSYDNSYLYTQFAFIIENPPLNVTLINPTNGSAVPGGTEVQLAFTGTDGRYIYSWDDSDNFSNSLNKFPRTPGTLGLHTLKILLRSFDQEWLLVSYQFVTENSSLVITLVTPGNGSFLFLGAPVTFDIEGFNGTLQFSWDDAEANSTKTPFNTTLTAPSELGLHHLRIFIADWQDNWISAYYEFTVAHFLTLRVLNGPTGRLFTEGQVIVANQLYTSGPIALASFPIYGLPLEPGNYFITFIVGELSVEDSFEVVADTMLSYSIAALTIRLYNITTQIPLERGFIYVTSNVGQTQVKELINQEVKFLVGTGFCTLTFWDPFWAYSQDITISVLRNQEFDWLIGRTEIDLYVRSFYVAAAVPNANITVLKGKVIFSQARTNSTGWVTLYLPQGVYLIAVTQSTSQEELQVSVIDVPQQLEVTIKAKADLTIHVNDESGIPLSNVVVQLKDIEGLVQNVYTDVAGEAVFRGVNWGPLTLKISYGEYELTETLLIIEGSYLKTKTISTGRNQLSQQVATGKWPGRRSYTIEDTKQQLKLYEKFLLSVIATAITLVAILTVLSLLGVFATVAHPLLDERNSVRIIRTLGATKQQTLGAVTAELILPASAVSFLASILGLLVASQVPLFRVVSVGGFMIRPVASPILVFYMVLIIGLMVVISVYLHILKMPEMDLEK